MNTRKRNKTALLLAIMVMIWLGSVANADDLIAYWPLDEGTGDIAYDAIGDNDGQLVGDPIWISPGQGGTGALYFNGGNYVNCGIGVTAAPDLTVALWINADDHAYQCPMAVSSGGYSPEPGWTVMLRLEGGVWFRIDGPDGGWDGGDLQIDEAVYEPDTWVHMVFTFDSETLELNGYINGELRGTNTVAPGRSVANTEDDLRFGSDSGAGVELYSGVLDEIAIWDIALTAEEVLDVYKFGFDPNAPYVNAGPDMITISDLSVEMVPTVVNNDTFDPQRELTYEWSASTGDYTVDFAPDEFALAPTVTITDDTPDNPTTVTLTLSAQLVNPSGPPEKARSRPMNIDVYDDACKAIVAAGLPSPYDPGDVNLDCITDLRDIAISSTKWLDDYTLTEPVSKP